MTSLVAQSVKHLLTMWETQVRSLGWEDPLEKKMATHSSTLAWKIPWTEEPGGLQSMGSQRVRQGWTTKLSTFSFAKSFNPDPNSFQKFLCTFSFVFYTEVPIKMYVYCHQEYHWYIVIFRLINEHFLVPILISVSL